MGKVPFSTVVFCSDDIFSSIMLRGLLKNSNFSVDKVYIEKERMGKNSNLPLFYKVVKNSGLRYAIYQGAELIVYSIMIKLLSFFKKNTLQSPRNQCAQYSIPCGEFAAASLKDNDFNHESYDILFCFRFSKILKGKLLSIAKIASVNFHGSLLPKYAGLGSIFQAINHGENEIGGSFHLMVEKIDGGRVVTQSKFPIDNKHSVSFHHLKVYNESSKLFDNVAKNIATGVTISNDSSEDEYFSFPDKKDVKKFHGHFLSLKDILHVSKIIKGDKA